MTERGVVHGEQNLQNIVIEPYGKSHSIVKATCA